MGICCVFGRSGVGKTHFVLEDIKKHIENTNQTLILIVPEQFTLQAERDLIEKLDLPGIMHIEVLSFTRLAHKVLNEVGGITRVHINEQGKNMILRKIIDEGQKNLTIYQNVSTQDGFIPMFHELLCELKQQDISPMDLLLGIDDMDENEILYSKIKDITYIYEWFESYLEGRYIDNEDYFNLLIEKMDEAKFLKDAYIWIDEFESFTSQTYRIIEKLMKMAKDFTITFSMDPSSRKEDGDLFKISEMTYEKISDMAFQNGLSKKNIDLNQENKFAMKKDEIHHIEKNIYSYPYHTFLKETKDIEIFAGVNIHREIENAVAQMINLVRERGYRWKDFSIVSNDLKSYAPLIKSIFEEYNIPYFLDQKREITHNPIVEFILSSLSIVWKGYRYEDVFRLLKTGFTDIDVDQYEKLENYALQYGIKGDRWKRDFEYGKEVNDLEEFNKYREIFIKPIENLEKKIKGKKNISEITKGLYKYLEESNLQQKIEKWIDYLRDKGKYEYVNENTQIWNVIMEVFDQLVEIMGDQRVSLKEYIRMLDSGFASIEIGIIPTSIDQVLIGNMSRSKSHDIKALFVLGVNDGILPSGKEEDGILSDEERMYMKEQNILLGHDRERKAYQEKFTIYSTFSKPSDYLWVSFSMADEEGKAMRPSILIDKLKKIFPKVKLYSDLTDEVYQQKRMIATPKSTFKHLVENIRMSVDGKEINPIWWDVYGWYYKQNDWQEKLKMVVEGFFHQNQTNYIQKDTVKKLYSMPIKSSVSRLEQFVNCPFAHFIKYGLKPQDRKIFEVKAPDIGQIFHRSMEAFTEKLNEQKIAWRQLKKDQCEAVMENVIDEMIPSYENGVMLSTNRYKYLVKRLKRISKRAVWTLTEHIQQSEFEPKEYEVEFGMNKKYPPITIEISDEEKIYVEGRIDRVDVLEEEDEYIKIIDYKSGDKDFNLSDVYYGFQLQLMIYLDAVLNGGDDRKPGGIFYFKIDDPMVKTEEKIKEVIEEEIKKKFKMKGLVVKDIHIVRKMDCELEGYSQMIPVGINKKGEFYSNSSAVDEKAFKELILHVRKLITEITHEIMKGNIDIHPCKNGKQTACDYCQYLSICQFDTKVEGNDYKNMKKLSDDEVIVKIKNVRDENGKLDG
ncbi:helicase-exonuclease AddAB subunit AddB [Inediibacterium massiliense]|uniref:helicase-exonuclease AddAB subunit AddB n=1 Tax=Inediibacterium massiliense TaxID=1658111 RepID=UPI0006B65B26|nr:helicase-exonuclease AddAB subunit AddB [Inediibacterium massiliense]